MKKDNELVMCHLYVQEVGIGTMLTLISKAQYANLNVLF